MKSTWARKKKGGGNEGIAGTGRKEGKEGSFKRFGEIARAGIREITL